MDTREENFWEGFFKREVNRDPVGGRCLASGSTASQGVSRDSDTDCPISDFVLFHLNVT